MNQRFGKEYKLCSKKAMDGLFSEGQKLTDSTVFSEVHGHRIYPTEKSFQIAVAVPKKKIKAAPERNRIKRLMREAIRLNKSDLEKILETQEKQLALFLIYQDSEKISYSDVENKIVLLLKRLEKRLSENK
jgi:ribonuclease P protein component